MIAYKFLCAGGIGPFSRYAWPLPRDGRPGARVAAPADPKRCATAVHGCRVRDLPWWLHDELWEAEFEGAIATGRHKISAPRARLLRRVEAWDRECVQRFADACALRARDHAVAALERAGDDRGAAALRERAAMAELVDAVGALEPPEPARIAVRMAGGAARRARNGHAVPSAYIAAHTAGRVAGRDAVAAERAWQSDWLRAELRLEAG